VQVLGAGQQLCLEWHCKVCLCDGIGRRRGDHRIVVESGSTDAFCLNKSWRKNREVKATEE
jgi:hypothetical protein